MDLVPENLSGAVVFNLLNSCAVNKLACGSCAEFVVAIHNYLMNSDVRYVLLDLQDEKDICPAFLEELMQLAKRLRVPFLLAGVMDRPRRILESYDFTRRWPLFSTPEDAIAYLEAHHPETLRVAIGGLPFGTAIATSRGRHVGIQDGEPVEAEAVD